MFLAFAIASVLASCATLTGGKITECQQKRPTDGTVRKVRIVPLVIDLFTGVVPLAIDFATGAIYKPCK